jgi:hypothetical protein
VEIICPWRWVDDDGETLEKSYRKKVGRYDILRQEFSHTYPNQKVDQTTIVVRATGVFHKKSQVESTKAIPLEGKDLARWQRNAVDMAIQGSYEIEDGTLPCHTFRRIIIGERIGGVMIQEIVFRSDTRVRCPWTQAIGLATVRPGWESGSPPEMGIDKTSTPQLVISVTGPVHLEHEESRSHRRTADMWWTGFHFRKEHGGTA